MKRTSLWRYHFGIPHYFVRPWMFVAETWSNFSAFLERGLYGYAREDVWDLFSYLNSWMPDAIELLIDNMHGCPAQFVDDNGNVEEGLKRWREILIKIRDGFRANHILEVSGLGSHGRHLKMIEFLKAKRNEGFALFITHYESLWD